MRLWSSALPALLLCGALAGPGAAKESSWILVEDAADWRVSVYAGSRNVRTFVPGNKLGTRVSGMIVFDSRGNGYVAAGSFVAIITPEGRADVLTGHTDLAGNTDGPPGRATFGNALDIARVNDDLMYVADAANFTLRELRRKDGVWHTKTVAGVPGKQGHRDGPGHQALFRTVFDSVAADNNGVVYVFSGDWIRKYENGVVTTLNPEGGRGYRNGPLRTARFIHSQGRTGGLALDGKGNLYVADKVNTAIRKIDLSTGTVTTLAGRLPTDPKMQPRDGDARSARFHPGGGPTTIQYDPVHKRFYVHSDDERVTRVILTDEKGWKVRTLAAPWGKPGEKRTVTPFGGLPAGVDPAGNLYLLNGGRILKFQKSEKPAE
jgi:hypothetical protein